jgi:hypothetical protein
MYPRCSLRIPRGFCDCQRHASGTSHQFKVSATYLAVIAILDLVATFWIVRHADVHTVPEFSIPALLILVLLTSLFYLDLRSHTKN